MKMTLVWLPLGMFLLFVKEKSFDYIKGTAKFYISLAYVLIQTLKK